MLLFGYYDNDDIAVFEELKSRETELKAYYFFMTLNLSWDICIFPINFCFCRMKAIHKFNVSGKNMYMYFSVGFELPVQTPASTFLGSVLSSGS